MARYQYEDIETDDGDRYEVDPDEGWVPDEPAWEAPESQTEPSPAPAPAPAPPPAPVTVSPPPGSRPGQVPDEEEHDTAYGGQHHSLRTYGTDFRPQDVPSGIPQDWAKEFLSRNPGDYERLRSAYASEEKGGGGPRGASGGGGPAFTGGGGFDDPASALLEAYGLDQFGRRINPDPNSGTALFEKYARELIDTLKQPVYSPQDEAVIKTRAFDGIEQERTATKQRWLEEINRRGIQPSSGVALDGLQRIEQHFNGLRTTVEREFAADAIAQTRQQRLQVLDTAGRLSDAEEGRLREAGTYARIPYDLQDRAFQRNLQLVGAAGSPADLFGSGMTLANFGQTNAFRLADYGLQLQQLRQQDDLIRSGNRAQLTAALLQYLGYAFGR